MRHKSAVLVLFILVALSLTGQEEPLPVVAPRPEPTVFLAVEPQHHDAEPPTLTEAARTNDYPAFHALYVKSRDARFAALDELWTYAMNDPMGAFYGEDMHDRLARAFPGYAAYIDDLRIVDNNGNAFYPTSETRAFLLKLAESGEARAPKVLIARNGASAASAVKRPHVRRQKAALAPLPAVPKRVAPQRVAPAVAAAAKLAQAQPVAPAVVTPTPAQQIAAASMVTTTARPDVKSGKSSQGILLLIVGLIGIGLLVMIIRAPSRAT